MSDPFRKTRQTTTEIHNRIRKLDSDMRALLRDESIRPDVRQQRALQLRNETRAELQQLVSSIPKQLRQEANSYADSSGIDPHPDYRAGLAAQRTLYSTRAAGMLAAGDLAGIQQTIRDAIRAGDKTVAQEYLTVAGHKLSQEYGAREVQQLRNAAMSKRDAERAAIRKGIEAVANGPMITDLQRHIDTAVERAGGGDPYEEGDPTLGRAVSLWQQRAEDTATDAGVKAADAQLADTAAVVEGS